MKHINYLAPWETKEVYTKIVKMMEDNINFNVIKKFVGRYGYEYDYFEHSQLRELVLLSKLRKRLP